MAKWAQKGFTLIELMIAIVLGLLLVAAAFQLFFSSQTAYRIQQAGGSVQDNGIIGLSVISQSLRLANYGNLGAMNDETLRGGVVLSGETASSTPARNGNLKGYTIGGAVINDAKYVTAQEATDSAYDTKSDRLVILYQAPKDMMSCDGNTIKGPETTITSYKPGQYVIEKYTINKTGTAAAPDATLTCKSAIFDNNSTAIPDYSSNGDMVLNHIDAMKIQLIVRTNTGLQTLSINDYKNISISDTPNGTQLKSRPAIVGINLTILVRSNEKIGAADGSKIFNIGGINYTAPNDGYMRKVYTTTIAFRNGGLNGELIP